MATNQTPATTKPKTEKVKFKVNVKHNGKVYNMGQEYEVEKKEADLFKKSGWVFVSKMV